MNHKPSTSLASFSAWALVALGLAHIGFGVVKFQAPLLQAASSGFVGMFSTPEVTRTAFWFVLFGLPLVLAGHVAVRAAEIGDLVLLRIIGGYVFLASLLGVAAFPASPFWASLVVSALLVAAGLGVKRAREAAKVTQVTATDNAGVLAPAPVFFGIAIAAGYLLGWLLPTMPLSFPYSTAFGVSLIVVSIALVLLAVVPLSRAQTAFDARKPTTSMVTTGAFKISRNPTYLSLALLQLGLAFASHSVWLLVTALPAVAITHWGVILREERYLEGKFGDEYRHYAANVRRWL